MRELTAFPDRHVGGPGNRAATRYFSQEVSRFRFEVSATEFPCMEWEFGDAWIEVEGERFELEVGPYSPPMDGSAKLISASTQDELDSISEKGCVLLLHGEIAAGQLMPKNFVWYNPVEHQRAYRSIEALEPLAVIAATGKDPQLVGGQYPFPLIEDGDFDFSSAYMKDIEGERLAAHKGKTAQVHIDSARVPATAEHVIARRAGIDGSRRIVVSAHIDSRRGSPGGLDNASGVATLLMLAELLSASALECDVELVPFNGEDNYANAGEMMWAAENEGLLGSVVLGINIDDSGQNGAKNGVSFYECPDVIESEVRSEMEGFEGLVEGPKWYQGDHMILVQGGRPCIAVASTDMHDFMANYAHTERDTIELADFGLIAQTAAFVTRVIERVSRLDD
jgi:aminopeptidase YwaD